jgi:hypothetical protein
MKKTSHIIASPFLKNRKGGETSPKKIDHSAEKSRREEQKSISQKTTEDNRLDWRRY